jgi:Methyltransferase domain
VTGDALLELAHAAVREHGAQQKPLELAAFGGMIIEHGFNTVVEVGTYAGGTAWFLHSLGLDLTVVDKNLGQSPRLDGVRYIDGDSAPAARQVGLVDVAFIDGDHSYDGVKRDWEAYRPFASAVAFHDIVDHGPDTGCDVDRLWDEIKTDHEHLEIIDQEDTSSWAGIGVVFPVSK